jgi:predicted DCC family thiol-disulfide oxidoreductase YuxK
MVSTITASTASPLQPASKAKPAELVLLFDGLCGFCDTAVQHIFKHDKKGTMMFAPLQSDFAKEVLDRHPKFKSIDSMIVIERIGKVETAYARSAAALRIGSYLGGVHSLANVFRIIPSPIRDLFYKLFAKNRYRLFGKKEACPIPTKEQRARYLAMP